MKYIHTFWTIMMVLILCNACKKDEKLNQHQEEKQQEVEHLDSKNTVTLTQEQLQWANLQLDTLVQRNIAEGISCLGMVEMPPQYEANIHSPMQGRVKDVRGLAGQQVKKGEVIAKIEHGDVLKLKEEYLSVKNELEFCELEVKRQSVLSEENSIALKKLQETKMRKEVLTAQKTSLKNKLKLVGVNASTLSNDQISPAFYIRAPFDGYISGVSVKLGDYVGEHDPLFSIVSPDHMHVEVFVYESRIKQVQLGQKVHFFTGNEGMIGIGDVYLINKMIDPQTKTAQVHAHIDHKYEKEFIPGMSIQAEILTNAQYVYTLPEFAIIQEEGQSFIFVQKNQKEFEKVKVSIGETYKGYTQIKSYQELLGQQIVVQGSNKLATSMMEIEGHHHH